MDKRENPFRSALFRDVVDSADFIGREHILQQIKDAVISPREQKGSIAIIGLPDIGKRCLIERAIQADREAMYRQKTIYIEVDIATYTEPDKHEVFFRDLITLLKYKLEDTDFATPQDFDIEQLTRKTLREWDEGVKSFSTLKNFFEKIYEAGFRVIFILDNFDHAESLFRKHTGRIHWLRQLTGSGCRVSWIALSCKPIREIKRLPKAISDDFANELYLGMYTDEEMQVYFHLLAQQGMSLTKEQKTTIIACCGRHPYLLALLGYHLVEEHACQTDLVDIAAAFARVEERFNQSYERIIDLVLINDNDDEKLQKLGQILAGQTLDVEKKVIEQIQKYGLILPNPAWSPALEDREPAYLGFSEHFRAYFFTKLASRTSSPSEREQDILSWNETMYPDEIIAQRYKVTEHLGTTRHNQVVKAWDEKLPRYVVLKRLHLAAKYGEKAIRQEKAFLLREAKILAALKHRYIATIYDVIDTPPIIVMEWIEGQTLDHYWLQGLAIPEVVRLGYKLADTLRYLHMRLHAEGSKIIHRDIKPQNIMIRHNGDPTLIDFGIARAAHLSTIHPYDEQGNAEFSARTPAYSAPEQQKNPNQVTDRADIYALGLVLYETLTAGAKLSGQLQPDQPLDERIPVVFWNVLCAMLSEEPQTRPDAGQLCQELERCLQLLGIPIP